MADDEAKIRAAVASYNNHANMEEAKAATAALDDSVMLIRPDGTPVDPKCLLAMFTDDIRDYSNEIVSIDKIKLGSDMAYVVLTQHQKYVYKGTPSDDISVVTLVLTKSDGEWRVDHMQRSTGKPASGEEKK